MVAAAKQALHHAIPPDHALTFEQLITAFAEVEAVLNARPLAYVSGDPQDLAPLTPNHFLYGAASQPIVQLLSTPTQFSCTRKWNELKAIVAQLHRRFQKEIVPHYRLTHSHGENVRDLAVGDVVTFFLPSAGTKWPLAVVDEVYPGRDGRVRTVRIKQPQLAPDLPYIRRADKHFVRDVGHVALLLPARSD